MKRAALAAGLVAWMGAALASLCCLLPLAVIVLGLGSGAFMATTMQYRWLLVPAGIIGIVAGFVLYRRERRRCDALASLPDGRQSHHARAADPGEPGRRYDHRARSFPRVHLRSAGVRDDR